MEQKLNEDSVTNYVSSKPNKPDLQLIGSGGRIPLAVKTVDTLPQLWISVEMANKLASALNEIARRIQEDARTLSHYGSSAKHLIETLKGEETELEALLESHERLLGGTMHALISRQIATLREELTVLDERLGNRAKRPKK